MMKISLKPGKDKPVRAGNPWVFSGAVADVFGKPDEHNLCIVCNDKDEQLGIGYYNEKSAIRIRILKFNYGIDAGAGKSAGGKAKSSKGDRGGGADKNTAPLTFTGDDLYQRVNSAVSRRRNDMVLAKGTDSCRLVNSEGDFLPGLIVDKFGPGVCVQIGTAGMETWRFAIISALEKILAPAFIYERSDTESRKREGLEESEGLVSGALPDQLIIQENGVRYHTDLRGGQKTGFFFDQRANRALVRHYSAGRNVCDCFSYTGGFALNAALGGAKSVRAVDTSAAAGVHLAENAKLNGVSVEFIESEVFGYLRKPQPPADLLILDPPKFARHPGEVERASRGYKDINLAGLKMLRPGGIMFTFSCSGAVDPYLFRQIVFAAAADARRQIQLLHVLTAGSDHPVNIAHKEGEYLKGLVLRVI
ncbi:MAG: class I SAM-dependent rRNA methyltransferase [Chitinispirillia bacterium]|nr:class I SAM-dependent rRNA methyltransferase [Chitinispirillia bacterium]MCL2268990.1 class I SAM-dependent rRNA methyltransferase [Chitinispirillia bacterium]